MDWPTGGRTPPRGRTEPVGVETVEEIEVELADDELRDHLRARFLNPSYRPPVLPAVAVEITRLADQRDVRLPDVVELLERDPVLAGRVLRVASSPLYTPSARGTLKSLRDAVIRLGLSNLRDIVLETVLHLRVFRAKQYARDMSRVARHSSATAHLARMLGRRTGFGSDYAFLCGLFHDVGVAGILLALGDQPGNTPVARLKDAWPTIDACHMELSGVMIGLWEFSPEIKYVVERHHGYAETDDLHPLVALVSLAEHLANTHDWAISPVRGPDDGRLRVDATLPADVMRALEVLGIDRAEVASHGEEAEVVLKSVSAAF